MIEIDDKTGLVLEGGGLRGVFTCGVLDCFMDNGIRFPFAVGVSAGACNGLTQRCIMDFKLLDYDTYFSNPDRFVMVTTNCLSGKAEYLEEKLSSGRVMDIVRASSSLPFVSPVSYVDGVPMLDGGIVDSIPVEYAMGQGYEKLVVVLTRNKGYRKKDDSMPLARLFYHRYPELIKALSQRNTVYNKTMELIEKLEDEGRIRVIRPVNPVEVGRMEKDTDKLRALYQEGYAEAERMLLFI